MNKDYCTYCTKWLPVEQMKQIPGGDIRNWYCPKCYPEVLAEHRKLPWNRK